MASLQAHLAAFFVRRTVRPALGDMSDVGRVRRVFDATRLPAPGGVAWRAGTVGGVPGEWVEARGTGAAAAGPASGPGFDEPAPRASGRLPEARPVLLYLHGGGFVACSPATHRPITAALARHGFSVFVPHYRLAPEHPYPAALDDARAAWGALRDRARGVPGAQPVLAGDSAGGSLALALMLALRDAGEPQPAGAALFSPVTDLAGTGASIRDNSERDPMFGGAALEHLARAYLDGADVRAPLVSPLYADLTGLAPLLIHVGEREVLRDDSLRLAERARAAGVPVRLRVWPVVPHVWQLMRWLPEARESIGQAARFLHAAADERSRPTPARPAPASMSVLTSASKSPTAASASASASASTPAQAPASTRRDAATDDIEVDTLVIGAGFSGLAAAARLDEAGFSDFLIVDRGDDVGGTWRDNHYPGAACDIPSHLYSLSFEPRADWTRAYPRQPELLAYLRDVARRRGLLGRLRLRCTVREAAWDDARARWTVRTDDGATIRARVVISGAGALHWPAIPKLAGLERFERRVFHSSQWDHGCDLAGKRVAVVGTGASAIQFVPEIAPRTERLHVFQRTAPWVVPKRDHPIGARRRALLRALPVARQALRAALFWAHEARVLGFLRINAMNRAVQKMARAHLARQVPDAALRRKLTPDYAIGCKRVLISNDWYPTLMRPDVEVVTEPVAQVRAGSIVTADGTERAVDVIIFGTGFETTDAHRHVRVTGRGGRTLAEAWRDGMQAYRGVSVAGFPNWFMLLGPNTGLGHNSVVLMIEAQVGYVLDCLARMRAQSVQAIDVAPEAQRRDARRLQRRLARTVWQAGGCRSWYQDEHGRNTTLWPGSVVAYQRLMRRVPLEDYLAWRPA